MSGRSKWGPLVKGGLHDAAALDAAFSRYEPAAVVHFAAFAYVGESVTAITATMSGGRSRCSKP